MAEQRRDLFVDRCRAPYPAAADTLLRDWERMVTYYDFPREHWKHLRTTNPVESPFAAVRLRTDAGKRFKKVLAAAQTGLSCSMRLLVHVLRPLPRRPGPDTASGSRPASDLAFAVT